MLALHHNWLPESYIFIEKGSANIPEIMPLALTAQKWLLVELMMLSNVAVNILKKNPHSLSVSVEECLVLIHWRQVVISLKDRKSCLVLFTLVVSLPLGLYSRSLPILEIHTNVKKNPKKPKKPKKPTETSRSKYSQYFCDHVFHAII